MSTPSEHHHHHHHHAVAQNQEYFNNEAADYDAKHQKTLDKLIEEIRARVDFIGAEWVDDDDEDQEDEAALDGDEKEKGAPKKSVRLLDYACGTGVVSRVRLPKDTELAWLWPHYNGDAPALAPYTTQCVGIDLSENMASRIWGRAISEFQLVDLCATSTDTYQVAAYNARAENQGLAASEMHAYQGNLCVPEDPNPHAFTGPEFHDFDVAVVGLGFHHFDDPALAARRLAERLRLGGVLVILDFFTHDKPDPSHPAATTITHHGFSEEQMRKMYEEAGVAKDFALAEVAVVFHHSKAEGGEVRRKIFIARGTKA